MKVLDFPLVKITFGFIIGVIIAYYEHFSVLWSETTLLCSFIFFCLAYFIDRNQKKQTIFFGLAVYLISITTGSASLLFHTEKFQKDNYTHCETAFLKPQEITLILREKIKSNDYNDRYIAILKKIGNKTVTGKVLLNVHKDSLKTPLLIGNILKIKTVLQKNVTNKNPNQFDYSRYLADKQIYARLYSSKAAIKISPIIQKDIWYYTGKFHTRIVENLEKAGFNKAEMNVTLALILGQQQEISSDIIQDYQYSGATHVLSVSGLHVGFIMLFITFILKPIPNTKKGSAIKLATILTSLAVFAVISGLSPAVLRSVVMFSFVACGTHLRRGTNIYHTLLVSILLILLFQPYFLFDAGFQLSYLALFFIVWLQPELKKLWSPKNKIVIYIWDALTVSFAAQIGTMPLCLYYFHQFPGLFFVTNIIILPLLSFIMIAGIIVILFAIFIAPPHWMIFIFEKSIYILNQMIHAVASLESFVIRDISFNFSYLTTCYLVLFFSVLWLKKPNYNNLIMTLCCFIVLQLSFIYTKRETGHQNEFVVFNVSKNTLIAEKNGKSIHAFSDNENLKNKALDAYVTANFGLLQRTEKLKNLLFFNGHKILVIDSTGIYPNEKPEIVIVTNSPKINAERMLEKISPKLVIADATNSKTFAVRWEKSCLKKNIPFHFTKEKGYFRLNSITPDLKSD
ncbi:ComEC/Rec2 family competence protein [Flavobacterium foetidum]|uniref:ComEC/Rec2 family competence protein n=1 Tax=Flavobacterium foetidum TaxID=2026681 RepID=UPI0010757CDA|nr:ComEC/Rec2 family competence protein [Flavobacterium foetidum]KAF2515973.1 ComEC family competence protein [Flavobacterium foetidum]